jgi:hypothetical protein
MAGAMTINKTKKYGKILKNNLPDNWQAAKSY